MEGVVAIIFIFGGATACLLAFSPVGQALAARLQGRGAEWHDAVREVEALERRMTDEVGTLRQELIEVQERLDFAERLLAQHRARGDLAPAGARVDVGAANREPRSMS